MVSAELIVASRVVCQHSLGMLEILGIRCIKWISQSKYLGFIGFNIYIAVKT